MRHDDRADEPGAHAPARRPAELLCPRPRLELNPARARKILAEKMRGAGLDRLPVLDHRFDAERLDRARKPFALGFFAAEDRDREMIAHERFVDTRASSSSPRAPRLRFRGRYVLPAREIPWFAERGEAAFPSGRRSPID